MDRSGSRCIDMQTRWCMASAWSNLRRTPAANSLHADGALSSRGCHCATRSLVARTTGSFPRDNVAKSSASHAEEMATVNCDLLVYRVFARKPPENREVSLSRSILCGIVAQPQLAGAHTSYFVGKRFT